MYLLQKYPTSVSEAIQQITGVYSTLRVPEGLRYIDKLEIVAYH